MFSSVITFHASVGQNPYLCESGQCNFEKKQKNIATPIVASISGVLILLVAVAILWTLKRRKSKGNAAILKDSYFFINDLPNKFILDLLIFQYCRKINSFDGSE